MRLQEVLQMDNVWELTLRKIINKSLALIWVFYGFFQNMKYN